jgi:hypothetical protein
MYKKIKIKTLKIKRPPKGWTRVSPGTHDRTVMLKKCGKKCFLGTHKSFPICRKNTCKRDRKGVYAAYIRAKQTHHNKIAKTAKKILLK